MKVYYQAVYSYEPLRRDSVCYERVSDLFAHRDKDLRGLIPVGYDIVSDETYVYPGEKTRTTIIHVPFKE